MHNNSNHIKAVSEQAWFWDYKLFTEESGKKSDWDQDSPKISNYRNMDRSGIPYWSRNVNKNYAKNNDIMTKGKEIAFFWYPICIHFIHYCFDQDILS